MYLEVGIIEREQTLVKVLVGKVIMCPYTWSASGIYVRERIKHFTIFSFRTTVVKDSKKYANTEVPKL